ncbi:MAG: hypothetical protein L0271_18250, partial [Gemmatimonadetes bacterium]|nr:hypothetical protein [Gemmatimonadota bacterium]
MLGGSAPPTLTVVVDMDAAQPGVQSTITVSPGAALVRNVAVYGYEPTGAAQVWAVGYLGGLDRGIAFGHAPNNLNQGSVTALTAAPGTPLNPGSTILLTPFAEPAFFGAETQYLEHSARSPAPIQTAPLAPMFTVDVHLQSAAAGDVFNFHLVDFVAIWSGGQGGAFSTQSSFSLDTGGDATPDGSVTMAGVDLDAPLAAPPASFVVDFVDGP